MSHELFLSEVMCTCNHEKMTGDWLQSMQEQYVMSQVPEKDSTYCKL